MIPEMQTYIKNTEDIRTLSTPSIGKMISPVEYEKALIENFTKIGNLAQENRQLLAEKIMPMIHESKVLDLKQLGSLDNFCDALMNGTPIENLDVPLAIMIADQLITCRNEADSIEDYLHANDDYATACYLVMNFSKRTSRFSDTCDYYRREGMKACDYLLSWLPYEKWTTLPTDEAKALVLDLARYKSVFYENICGNPQKNAEEFAILQNAAKISKDSRYINELPNYDWDKYKLRLGEYFILLTENGNKRGFNHEQCMEMVTYANELEKLWEEKFDHCSQFSDYNADKLAIERTKYIAGVSSRKNYKKALMSLYQMRDREDYSLDGVFLNVLVPLEYILLVERGHLSEEEKVTLEGFYKNAISYTFHLPNSGALIFVLEYMVQLLEHFLEVPGGITFEELGLSCLAALHPPTYTHSVMVARITRCLCWHLIADKPELFVGLFGTTCVEEVHQRMDEIVDYSYHAALCHDFGKLAIIDTVFVYGRNILDIEFEQIKAHPQIGEELLARNTSTASYKNIAYGHHKWYDNSAGYPVSCNTGDMVEKTIIDLVCCADCMDAATDHAGRSYNKGKSLAEYTKEVELQAGSRYAPYLPELLQKPAVITDLEYLLSEGRGMIYRDTFAMLHKLQEQET